MNCCDHATTGIATLAAALSATTAEQVSVVTMPLSRATTSTGSCCSAGTSR
jgi:hypothetical protein